MTRDQAQNLSDLHLRIAKLVDESIEQLRRTDTDPQVIVLFELNRDMHEQVSVRFAKFAREADAASHYGLEY
jgi:hypothetical protein